MVKMDNVIKPTMEEVTIIAEVYFASDKFKPSTTKKEIESCVETAGFRYKVKNKEYPVKTSILNYDKKHRAFRCYANATIKFVGEVPAGTVTVSNFEKAVAIAYDKNDYDVYATPWNNEKCKSPTYSVNEIHVKEITF